MSYFEGQLPNIIQEILRGQVTPLEANELSQRLNTFPALRSTLRANLYVNFIHIVHGTRPAYDKIDDYRHVVDASYCSAIVLSDEQLGRTVNRINPDLCVLGWEDVPRGDQS